MDEKIKEIILLSDKKYQSCVDLEDFLECMKLARLFNDDKVGIDELINEINVIKQE